MSAMTSPITGFLIVYSTVCSDANQRKHQSSAPLAFVRGIHRPVNSPHKGPVSRKMFPFDDVIMWSIIMITSTASRHHRRHEEDIRRNIIPPEQAIDVALSWFVYCCLQFTTEQNDRLAAAIICLIVMKGRPEQSHKSDCSNGSLRDMFPFVSQTFTTLRSRCDKVNPPVTKETNGLPISL